MMNNEKKMFRPRNFGIVVFIIVISPLIVSVLSIWAKPLTFIEFDSSVWIGFWGSYLGGIIGTIGVIYVARLQNNKQQEENEKMMLEQRKLNKSQIESQIESLYKTENFNRERLRLKTQIKIIEDYIEALKILQNDLYIVKFGLVHLIGRHDIKIIYDKAINKDGVESSDALHKSAIEAENKYRETKKQFIKYDGNYFSIKFEDIHYRNVVLNHKDIQLNMPDSSFVKSLDDILRKINSTLNELNVNQLKKDYADENNNFPDVENAWNWVRDEKANAYISLSKLIKKFKENLSYTPFL